ncbi:helix-turn-helix domain-containing protein, partial [Patescibacteria group bacterium]|nr:helix-turn-helix domain-containing protein [Patescibacteria group bacterium]
MFLQYTRIKKINKAIKLKKIPTFLKKIRQKEGISQEFLAKKIGISRPTYAQIENSERD